MYRVIFIALIAAASANENELNLTEWCPKLGYPGALRCCKMERSIPVIDPDDMQECMMVQQGPHSCDRDLCLAKKKGFATADGALDKTEFENMFSEDFKMYPDIVEDGKKNCFNGDLTAYGSTDACEIIKLEACLRRQIINHCEEWRDVEPCPGIQRLVEDCLKQRL